MSRRQHTTLILQVRMPVPVGKTQAQTVEWLREILTHDITDPFKSAATLIKLIGRETTYL